MAEHYAGVQHGDHLARAYSGPVIPLKDYNPTRRSPIVTLVIIAACVVIYFFVQPRQSTLESDPAQEATAAQEEVEWTVYNAAIPCELVKGRPLSQEEFNRTFESSTPDDTACESDPNTPAEFPGKNVYLSVLYSMFLHGSILHLLGNMLFLWIFGNNIEDKRGHVQYAIFYLISGVVATAAHVAIDPSSTVPMVGASGAIAGVMGAYLVMFPNARIRSLIILGFFVLFRDIRAKWLLGIWFVMQFFTAPNSGVAWMAHVGGFVVGLVAGLMWRVSRPTERVQSRSFPY
jgi:membrane associated rhomboid family serine protease